MRDLWCKWAESDKIFIILMLLAADGGKRWQKAEKMR